MIKPIYENFMKQCGGSSDIKKIVTELANDVAKLKEKEDKDTIFDPDPIHTVLLEIGKRIDELESKEDKDTVFDPSNIHTALEAIATKVDELANKPDNDTVFDPTDIHTALQEIAKKVDEMADSQGATYDDSSLVERIQALEAKEDADTVYDDTALSNRVTALEEKQDNDTVYDDTALANRVTALEEKADECNCNLAPIENRLTALETNTGTAQPTDSTEVEALKEKVKQLECFRDTLLAALVDIHTIADTPSFKAISAEFNLDGCKSKGEVGDTDPKMTEPSRTDGTNSSDQTGGGDTNNGHAIYATQDF